MRSSICVFIALLLLPGLWAQSELTLPTLEHLLESDRQNPALSNHEPGFYIGLPSVSYDIYHTGPGYRDLITSNDGRPLLQIKELAKDLNGDNELISAFRLQTIKFLWRARQWSIGFEHELVYHGQIMYPDELIQLYVSGNQQWIGQSIDIAPTASIWSYNNYAMPIAFHTGKFSLGIRPRVLAGNHLGRTARSQANLYTDEEFYQLTLTTNYLFQSVGIIDFEDANLLNYQIGDLRSWNLTSNHLGWALDIGARWDISDRGTLALSGSDMGQIKWREIKSYLSDRVTEYNGVEVIDLFELGAVDFDQALDSLNAIFDIQTSAGDLVFPLPARWQAHFSYQLTEHWRLSTSFTYEAHLNQPWNIGVVCTGEIKPKWYIGASISNRYGDLAAGFHSSLSWGQFTGFLISDQILSGLDPLRANHFQMRAGLNWRI